MYIGPERRSGRDRRGNLSPTSALYRVTCFACVVLGTIASGAAIGAMTWYVVHQDSLPVWNCTLAPDGMSRHCIRIPSDHHDLGQP